jgi:thioredoxin-disulfide reductase
MTSYDLIIIGGGIAGFSAAMYAGRMKIKTLVIAEKRGGTIITTNDIRNWPGIKEIDGMTLAKQIEEHANEYGINIVDGKVNAVEKSKDGFAIKAGDSEYSAKAIIFATGTETRKLGVKGETEFSGRGVHYCALCDGFFYNGKTIAVIGGSDSAAKEALLLTQWASKVYVIARSTLHPEPVNMERIKQNKKIELIEGVQIVEIKGEKKVKAIMLDKPHNGSTTLALDGIFVEVGRIPNSELAKSLGVNLNRRNEITIDRSARTNITGVYAAGDVSDAEFKQAIVASGEGVTAACSVYEYLNKKKE